jgi:hypothetical protein
MRLPIVRLIARFRYSAAREQLLAAERQLAQQVAFLEYARAVEREAFIKLRIAEGRQDAPAPEPAETAKPKVMAKAAQG